MRRFSLAGPADAIAPELLRTTERGCAGYACVPADLFVSKPANLTFRAGGRRAKLTPAIDRTHSLSEASEAMRYLEEGHARGKIVITV